MSPRLQITIVIFLIWNFFVLPNQFKAYLKLRDSTRMMDYKQNCTRSSWIWTFGLFNFIGPNPTRLLLHYNCQTQETFSCFNSYLFYLGSSLLLRKKSSDFNLNDCTVDHVYSLDVRCDRKCWSAWGSVASLGYCGTDGRLCWFVCFGDELS